MSTTPELAKSLRIYKVTSYVTGIFLLLISVLYALRLTISSDLWIAGPEGLFALAQFSVDPGTGERVGFPTQGFSFTTISLIVHGWLYVAYLYADFRLWTELRWGIGKFLIIAAGGVVPFLSFFTERYFAKVAEGWNQKSEAK
jgi:integral membrane protein